MVPSPAQAQRGASACCISMCGNGGQAGSSMYSRSGEGAERPRDHERVRRMDWPRPYRADRVTRWSHDKFGSRSRSPSPLHRSRSHSRCWSRSCSRSRSCSVGGASSRTEPPQDVSSDGERRRSGNESGLNNWQPRVDRSRTVVERPSPTYSPLR